jgi:hypothetical protein
MSWAPPTPEEQVLFLRNIQRLLAEGQFTASYKFALLLALAELAVVEGDDSGAPLRLETKRIAEKFIEYYWPQCRPYAARGQRHTHILRQNTDRQATIVTAVIHSQEQISGSLFQLRQNSPRAWRTLVNRVTRTVCGMPLWRLQTVGNERLDFLYDNLDEGTTAITLKPGVACCFRAFYGLLRDLIQAAWIRFVQKVNARQLGNLTDLGSFLFGRERGVLEAYRPILRDIQGGRCFYCHKDLKRNVEVDHFVPWSRYPTDLGHNFVLAHTACNNAKSDHIAAEQHLGAWIERNHEHAAEIGERLAEAALPHDLAASERIAEWAYEQTERANGQVWLSRGIFLHLGPDWRRLLVA